MIRYKYVQQNYYNIAVLFRCHFTWESRKEREREKRKVATKTTSIPADVNELQAASLCIPQLFDPPPSEITIVKYESVAAAGSSCRQFQLDNLDFSSASPSLAQASAFVSMDSRFSCSVKCETVQRGGCCTRFH